MNICKTQGFVLRRTDFRQTSLLVNLFTRDFGKMQGLIKGIKDPKKKTFLTHFEPFSLNHILFYKRSHTKLHLITEATMQDWFSVERDIVKFLYVNYFIELVDSMTVSEDKNTQIFDLLKSAFKSLKHTKDVKALARFFEIRLLLHSGFMPRLDSCVICQEQAASIARFSSYLGGLVCNTCFKHDRSSAAAIVVSKGAVASINHIGNKDWDQVSRLKLSKDINKELETIVKSFMDYHFDRPIKSRRFLN